MNFNLNSPWMDMINEQDVKFLDFNQFLKCAQISFVISSGNIGMEEITALTLKSSPKIYNAVHHFGCITF